MGLITSPKYCKYFLLFKLVAEHVTVLILFSSLKVIDVMFLNSSC